MITILTPELKNNPFMGAVPGRESTSAQLERMTWHDRRVFFAQSMEGIRQIKANMGNVQRRSSTAAKQWNWAVQSALWKFKPGHKTYTPAMRAKGPIGPTIPPWELQSGDLMQTQAAIQEYIKEISPALSRSFDRNLVPIARRAFHEWPVKTGRSKAAIFLDYQVSGSQLIALFGCAAPYTYYIKSSKRGESGTGARIHPSNIWIRFPGLKAAKKIAKDALRGIH